MINFDRPTLNCGTEPVKVPLQAKKWENRRQSGQFRLDMASKFASHI